MKYPKLVAAISTLVFVLAGCESGKESSGQDVSVDTGSASATDQQKQKQKPSGNEKKARQKPDEKRPTARATESGTLPETPPPEIEGLVKSSDLEKLMGTGSLRPTELRGKDPSQDYNAMRFEPEDSSAYGAGVQLWAFSEAGAAQKRLAELQKQYLNVQPIKEKKRKKQFGTGAFFSTRGGIRNFLFSIDEPPRVVALSCSADRCEEKERILALARRIQERVRERGRRPGAAKDSESKGGGSDD